MTLDDGITGGTEFSASHSHDCLLDDARENTVERRKQDYITVAILFMINLLNYMDRFTIAGIPDMVRTFYGIDSKMLGLLQTSFILSYMSLSPLFGYFGDRWKRKYLIIIGLILWSLVTLMSSFVPSDKFWIFLILRCLVGVGEASYSTLAPTILTDLFAGNLRTTVLGIFYFAVPVGSGLGFILGSEVARLFKNWAWALRITPIFGGICTVLLALFHCDPPRGRAELASHLKATSWWSDIKSLSANRCFLLVSFGFTGSCFVLGALSWFSVDYIQDAINAKANDSHAADKYNVAFLFGLSTCFAGLLGVLLGSYLGRRLRDYLPAADAYICAGGLLSSAPFMFIALMTAFNLYLCAFFVFIGQLLLCLIWALVADMTMSVVIPTRRATAAAYQMLLTHGLGDAISPLIIGAVADAQERANSLEARYMGMRNALFITVFVCVIAGSLMLISSWYLVDAKEKVHFIIEASRVGHFEVDEGSFLGETVEDGVTVETSSWRTFSTPTLDAGVGAISVVVCTTES